MQITCRRRRTAWLVLLTSVALSACTSLVRWDDGPTRHSTLEPRPEKYVVNAGDTLYSIAFRHNLDFRDVADWNGLGPSYLIRPGQVLSLRPSKAEPARPVTRTEGEVIVRREVPVERAPTVTPQPIPNPTASAPPAVSRPTPKPSPAPTVSSSAPVAGWQWPLQGKVLKGFDPPASKGMDIASALGTDVKAAAAGRVVYSGTALKGYGELIIIKHDDTYLSAYGYNRKRLVKEGDQVRAGQKIGEVGIGPEQQALLHFEIRRRGQPVNPTGLLPKG